MTLKKMLLLTSMAFAAVAFMAPAMAQADEWYTSGVKVGNSTKNGDTVELTGELSSTKGALRNGPCEVHAKAILWNEKKVATGEVTSLEITTPCWVFIATDGVNYTTEPCEITKATADTTVPWHITTTAQAAPLPTLIHIAGANFANTYSASCEKFGIPAGVPIGASGTATGTWAIGGNSISFANAGDLVNGLGEAVNIDGSLSKAGLELK